MNDLQKSLLEAMNISAAAAEKKSKRSSTIEARITDNSEAGTGTYSANYLGNIIEVHSSLSDIYAVGEYVMINVPEGNMDKYKTIIGSIRNGSTLVNTSAVSSGSSYASAGSNLLASSLTEQSYDVSSWVPKDSESGLITYPCYSYDHHIYTLDSTFKSKLKTYRSNGLNSYKFSVGVQAVVETSTHTAQGGLYGVQIQIPKVVTEGSADNTLLFTMETNNGIDGLIYNIPNTTLYEGVINVDSGIELDYDADWIIDFYAEGFYIEKETEQTKDIHFSSLSLQPVNKVNNNTYTLTIGGDLEINSGETSAAPKATLMYQGTEIAADAYYWFIYNIKGDNDNLPSNLPSGVTAKIKDDYDYIEYYNGQFLINPDTAIYTTNATMTIPEERFLISCSVKCVAVFGNSVYEADALLTNEQMIQNCNFILTTENGMDTFPAKGTINLLTTLTDNRVVNNGANFLTYGTAGIQYIFAFYSTTGLLSIFDTSSGTTSNDKFTINYLNKQEGNSLISNISINSEDIDGGSCVIKCSAYYMNETDDGGNAKLIKTCALSLFTAEDLTYSVIAENANVFYKYDSDGDSPLSGSAYNSTQTINKINPIAIRIYNKNGSEITTEQYANVKIKYRVSKNCMYDSLYIINSSDEKVQLTGSDYLELEASGYTATLLYYTINTKYSAAKNNNTIEITVTYDSNVFKVIAPIQFIKEGENGINATKYVSYICVDEEVGSQGNDDYAYEQSDENGHIHKLTIYNNEYYTLSNYDKIKKLDMTDELYSKNNGIKFDLIVFKDGERYTEEIPSVKFYWVNGGSLSDSTRTSVSIPLSELVSSESTKNNKMLCAEFTIENLTLTTYYSIDKVTYTGNLTIGDIGPTYDYGFTNVLYDADGGSPSYNSSQYPMISLGVENDYTFFTDVLDYQHGVVTFEASSDIAVNSKYFTPSSKLSTAASLKQTIITINTQDLLSICTSYESRLYDHQIYTSFDNYYQSISPEYVYNNLDDYWSTYYNQAMDCYKNRAQFNSLKENILSHQNYFTSPGDNTDNLVTEFYATMQVFLSDNPPATYTDDYIINTVWLSKFLLKKENPEDTIEDKYQPQLIQNYTESTENADSNYLKLTNYLKIKKNIINDSKITNKITFTKQCIFNYNQKDLGSVSGYNGTTQIGDGSLTTISAGSGNTTTGVYIGTNTSGSGSIYAYNSSGVTSFKLLASDGSAYFSGNTDIQGYLEVKSTPNFKVGSDGMSMGDFGICKDDEYGTVVGMMTSAEVDSDNDEEEETTTYAHEILNYYLVRYLKGSGTSSDPTIYQGVSEKELLMSESDSIATVQSYIEWDKTGPTDEDDARNYIDKGPHGNAIINTGAMGDCYISAKKFYPASSGSGDLASYDYVFLEKGGGGSGGASRSAITDGAVGMAANPNTEEDLAYLWAGYNATSGHAMFSVFAKRASFAGGKSYIDENGNFISGNCVLQKGNAGNEPVLTKGHVRLTGYLNQDVAVNDGGLVISATWSGDASGTCTYDNGIISFTAGAT